MSVVSTLTPSLGGSKPKMYRACREPCFLLPPSLSKCHACAYRSMYVNAKRSFSRRSSTAAHVRVSVSQPCFFVRLFRQLIFVSSRRTRTAASFWLFFRAASLEPLNWRLLLNCCCLVPLLCRTASLRLLLATVFCCAVWLLLRLAARYRSRHV